MRTKFFVLPLLVALLTSLIAPVLVRGAVASQTVVGQIGGVTNAVVLSGGQLYFNVGPRIVRMTVPDGSPWAPSLPGTYGGILPGIPVDIKVANGFVYVAMGRAGVAVVDGASLQPLGVLILPSTAYAAAVAVGPERLYVAAATAGIVSYNLGSDNKTLTYSATDAFTSPVRNFTDVEVLDTGTAKFLFASANNAATSPAERGGVLKFDVTGTPDPGTPSSTTQIDVNALSLSASVVYAAGDSTFYALGASALGILGTVALANPGVQLDLRPIASSAMYVFVATTGGLDVVDVTSPAAPTVAPGGPLLTGGSAVGLVASGEYTSSSSSLIYVADYNAGLTIVNSPLSAPGSLAVASQSYVQPKPAVASLAAGAYQQGFPFSNATTLWTVNSANPLMLSVVGSGVVPAATTVRSITTYNNLLLVSADTDGLLRYQTNAGAEPTSLGVFSSGGTAYASAVITPNAVVADGANGLTVVNISGTMGLVGNAPVPTDVVASSFELVDVGGRFAYVYDNDSISGTLRIYDLIAPDSPVARGVLTQTGSLDLSGVLAMKVSGNYLYMACGSAGIRVVDISNPDAPAFVGAAGLATLGRAQALAVYNGNLLIAEGGAGVELAAIGPTGALTNVTRFGTSGSAVQLALVPSNYLYVADWDGGLVAIQSSLLGVKWDTTTAITSNSPDPSVVGQPVAVSYTVAFVGGTPAGDVTVSDGVASCSGSVAAGTCTITPTIAGARVLTATYAGDAIFNGSLGTASHTVNQANTTTTIVADDPDPSRVGQAVTISYTVMVSAPGSGTPTGNVTVSDGAASCSASVAAGACTITPTVAGSLVLTATYAGDGNFNGSYGTTSHSVNQANATTTVISDLPDPSVVGQAVTVSYTVMVSPPGSGTPTGDVTVSDGAASCSGSVAAGTCTITPTIAGARVLTATYAGDASFNGSFGTASHTVNQANTTSDIVAHNPDPSAVGQGVIVSFTVTALAPGSGTPTGNVTVSDGVDSCMATVATDMCTITLTTPGQHTLTASYAGDANFLASASAGVGHAVWYGIFLPLVSRQ
jgi:hypothetical protein